MMNQNKNNKVNQNEIEIISSLTRSFSKDSLTIFLKELYKCLLGRGDNDSTEANLSKIAFVEFLPFPLFISERLLFSFTSNNHPQDISSNDFVNGFLIMYSEGIAKKIDLLAKICDFDLDGVVNIDDIILLFKQLFCFENDINNFNDIGQIIQQNFVSKKKITVSSLKDILYNNNGDMVYLFMLFFNRYCPFTPNQVKYFEKSSPPLLKKKSSKVLNGNVVPSKLCIDFFKKEYIASSSKITNNIDEIEEDDNDNDLDELNAFEEDIFQAISTFNTNEDSNQKSNITNDSDSNSYGQFKTANNKDINETLTKVLIGSSAKSSINKPEEEYGKVRSFAMGSTSNKSLNQNIIYEYENKEGYYEIKANYYMRSGLMKDCYIILIDDCLFVNVLNESNYKFLKIIPLKNIWIEEMEDCETLSHIILKRIKLVSYLNSFYKEMILSSQDQLEMRSFYSKLKGIVSKYHKYFDDYYFKSRLLLRGPYSQIFIGKNKKTNENIIIKQILHNEINKTQNYQLVLWEREVLKFLIQNPHPNIGKIYDIFRTYDSFYFVGEYITGGKLKNYLIDNRNKLTKNQLTNIIYQIANAVLFLHSHGIIHRDLKPENILVSNTSNSEFIDIKIIDFGFSKVLGKYDLVGESYGTLNYAAPEILIKTPYNFKADIWSLGVIFYVILCGSHPFGEIDKDIKSIHSHIINAKFTIPSKITSPFKEIILGCLKLDPKDRPQLEDIVKILKN